MKTYHVEILDEDGEVLTQVDATVARVADIECVRSADYVGILVGGQTAATGYLTQAQAKQKVFTGRRTPNDGGAAVEVTVRA